SRATCTTCSREIATRPHPPKKKGPLSGALVLVPKGKVLDRADVRRLQALLALHDLELDALAFSQRLVPVNRDRGEVDEHVLPLLALDEAIALLVREPLHGALRQLNPPSNNKKRPPEPTSRRPPEKQAP